MRILAALFTHPPPLDPQSVVNGSAGAKDSLVIVWLMSTIHHWHCVHKLMVIFPCSAARSEGNLNIFCVCGITQLLILVGFSWTLVDHSFFIVWAGVNLVFALGWGSNQLHKPHWFPLKEHVFRTFLLMNSDVVRWVGNAKWLFSYLYTRGTQTA